MGRTLHSAALLVVWLQPVLGATAARAPHVRPARAFTRAHVSALVGPISTLHSLGSAFESELALNPLRVNALVTGITYLLGDAIAQIIEKSKRSDGATTRPSNRRLCAKRLGRSFATGLLFLGPLTHFYYLWSSGTDLPVAAKVLLDNTVFLLMDNAMFIVGSLLLGGGVPAHGGATAGAAMMEDGGEVAEALAELWSMQLTGWKFLPLVAIVNYVLVPADKRVLFVDLADVAYAAMLSLHANAVDATPRTLLAADAPCAAPLGLAKLPLNEPGETNSVSE